MKCKHVYGLGKYLLLSLALISMAVILFGCGSDGSDGAAGPQGPQGPPGPGGTITQDPPFYTVFQRTQVSTNNNIANNTTGPHGESYLASTASTPVTVAITGATAVAGANSSTVTFTVTNTATGDPIAGLANTASQASFAIASLQPKDPIGTADGKSYNRWVPYVNRASGTTPETNYPYRERNSAPGGANPITDLGGGSYSYTFTTDLSNAVTYGPGGGPITFDRSRTHRVLVSLRSGYRGDGTYDFVPDGTAGSGTRNIIVEDATCNKCHKSIPGHYNSVKACVICHNPSNSMLNAAGTVNTLEAYVFLHKIHAGRELASAPGPDGIFFDDPTTPVDESADNGTYALRGLDESWRSGAFPAVIENCVVCHTGSGANVDNWKTVPSRAACGSCHDLINWATGTNHEGGLATSDEACTYCHPATGAMTSAVKPVEWAHQWTTKDIRNIPEFNVTVTTDTPSRGYYIAGESPVITMVLKDAVTGNPIDHTTVVEDPSGEGCVTNADKTACTNAADGLFRNANLYVTGPRAKRIQVLTTAARATISSATAGPWDLSAGGSLRVRVDSGNFIVNPDHIGEDVLVPGDFTVTLPAGTLTAAATAADVVAWLMSEAAEFEYNERVFKFSDRAIAYVKGGGVSIRTRALGTDNPTIQIPDLTQSLSGMFTDNAVMVAGRSVQVRQRTNPANNDPKAVWTAANIQYTLDPVDDLPAGTYMINVEFADRGRGSGSGNYRTPSIAVATFQVKQAGVENPIADGCTKCHWSTDTPGTGVGFVLDYPRHNKPFNAQAIDQCAGCHDYASNETAAARTWTTGGSTKPISKRVHAVHRGANLNYPVLTVDHEDTTIGRNWQITYPMNILNCESCHPATTSGTWKTNPNRLACMGCHDLTEATYHMQTMLLDPTPTAPWSGDEGESCAVCH